MLRKGSLNKICLLTAACLTVGVFVLAKNGRTTVTGMEGVSTASTQSDYTVWRGLRIQAEVNKREFLAAEPVWARLRIVNESGRQLTLTVPAYDSMELEVDTGGGTVPAPGHGHMYTFLGSVAVKLALRAARITSWNEVEDSHGRSQNLSPGKHRLRYVYAPMADKGDLRNCICTPWVTFDVQVPSGREDAAQRLYLRVLRYASTNSSDVASTAHELMSRYPDSVYAAPATLQWFQTLSRQDSFDADKQRVKDYEAWHTDFTYAGPAVDRLRELAFDSYVMLEQYEKAKAVAEEIADPQRAHIANFELERIQKTGQNPGRRERLERQASRAAQESRAQTNWEHSARAGRSHVSDLALAEQNDKR